MEDLASNTLHPPVQVLPNTSSGAGERYEKSPFESIEDSQISNRLPNSLLVTIFLKDVAPAFLDPLLKILVHGMFVDFVIFLRL